MRRPDPPLTAWAALLATVLPVHCAGCGVPDVGLCRTCARTLRGGGSGGGAEHGPVSGAGVLRARPPAPGCPPTWCAAAYDGPVREALVAWKDGGRHDLLRWLAPALARAVEQARAVERAPDQVLAPRPAGPLLLVPVPSDPASVRRRGRDVVVELAQAAALRLRAGGVAVSVAPLLRPSRHLRDQAGLDAAARGANLAGAHAVRGGRGASGLPCVLVDDVVTTGATVAEGARALRAAGADVLAAAAVAATPRRVPPTRRAAPGDGGPQVAARRWRD